MAQTPYGDIVGEIAGRLRRDTRSSSDVQTILEEIDWYRKMVASDKVEISKKPGIEEAGIGGKRSQIAKLERNDDALAKLRMQAMDLKKEWEKSEAGKGQ